MNRRMIVSTLRKSLLAEGVLMLIPMLVSIIYGEAFWPFASVALGLIILGAIGKKKATFDETIYSKEGFVIVGLVWIVWSAFGALPFVISGAIPNYIDAFFETVSGFTTTGSSILTNIESLPMGMLFWRSFTHWVGGMGVLVFISAIVPIAAGGRSMFILKAEMPGPAADKLVPKAKKTSQILYIMYLVLSLFEFLLLMLSDMPLFDSLVNTFGTAGTGGFAVKNAGIAAYANPSAEIIMTVFMCLFSLNFSIYFLIIMRKFKTVLRNEEMWTFIGIFVLSTAAIVINIMNLPEYVGNTGDAVRAAAFQTSSIMSSSGFSTVDFSNWPMFSQSLLLFLMFIGACAGSTGGGMKVVRFILAGKIMRRDLRKLVRPRNVEKVRMDGKVVEDNMLSGIKTYVLIYFAIVFGSFLILSIEGKDIITTFSSVVTCFNNIGPGLGKLVGPAGNFFEWSYPAKIILSFNMLLGRLEIFPILVLLMPSLWKKKTL